MTRPPDDSFSRSEATETILRTPPPPLGAIVRVSGVPTSRSELRLAAGSCVVGAGTEADIIVEDRAVSRRHVELRLCAEGVSVRDLDSRNGTFYLGQRIQSAVLSLGSRIRIGAVEVLIDADASSLLGTDGEATSYRGLIGTSAAMQKLFGILARLEGSLVNVLVEGPSGVGKELIVQALHQGSQVAAGPLVVVNCGAIGRELVLSELFGHKKGAFTGATEARDGAFTAADGGTLFLDEIGELPLEVQPTLLRALESGEVKPLGENTAHLVKVRVLVATNRNLQEAVDDGSFRQDLYYRLAVVKLRVPPLDERLDDVPFLASAFARQAGAGSLPQQVLDELKCRTWPGNVRELRNAVLAYLALGSLPEAGAVPGGLLEAALRQVIDASSPYQQQREAFDALFARIYFEALLEKTGGNQSEAARIGGIERSYFGKLLRKYGVK